MSDKRLYVVDIVTKECSLEELVIYPKVISSDNSISINEILDNSTDGKTFDLSSPLPSLFQTVTSGHEIAVYDNDSGVTVEIFETVVDLKLKDAGFTITDENGDDTEITLCQMMNNVIDNGDKIGG